MADKWVLVCLDTMGACETTGFGSTGGKTPTIDYLRYGGKATYANEAT